MPERLFAAITQPGLLRPCSSEVLVHFVSCVGSLALHCRCPQVRQAVLQSSLCFAQVSLFGDTLLVTAAVILENLGKSRQAEVISTMSNKIFLLNNFFKFRPLRCTYVSKSGCRAEQDETFWSRRL